MLAIAITMDLLLSMVQYLVPTTGENGNAGAVRQRLVEIYILKLRRHNILKTKIQTQASCAISPPSEHVDIEAWFTITFDWCLVRYFAYIDV